MKTIVLGALAMMAFAFSFGQSSNIVLFTEEGERFYAVMNGLRMNDEPVTNLKVTDLNQPSYKLKVIFENKDLGEMDKNIFVQTPGNEYVYMIKKNNKGEYKLAYRSETSIAMAPPAPPAQRVIVWGSPQPLVGGTVVEERTTMTTTTTGGGGMQVNTGVAGTSTTNTESVNMSVGINGFGMDVNVTASDNMTTGGMVTNENVTMSTTTTTTTTTSGGGWVDPGAPVAAAPCYGMAPGDFSDACNSIRAKSFEDSKLTLAKQVIRSQCISSEQVRDMSRLFDFEDTKLEFAKFAYPYAADPQNYYKVNDAFEFESSIEELDEYIHSQR